MSKIKEKEEKKVKSTKTWTVSWTIYEDGSTSLDRTNDGFTFLELLGVLNISNDDVIQQIKGNVKPDIITRQVITDKL